MAKWRKKNYCRKREKKRDRKSATIGEGGSAGREAQLDVAAAAAALI